MTNFEWITENESALVDCLHSMITCNKCPVLKKCSCNDNDKPCKRLLYEWLKSEAKEKKVKRKHRR